MPYGSTISKFLSGLNGNGQPRLPQGLLMMRSKASALFYAATCFATNHAEGDYLFTTSPPILTPHTSRVHTCATNHRQLQHSRPHHHILHRHARLRSACHRVRSRTAPRFICRRTRARACRRHPAAQFCLRNGPTLVRALLRSRTGRLANHCAATA